MSLKLQAGAVGVAILLVFAILGGLLAKRAEQKHEKDMKKMEQTDKIFEREDL